VADFVETALPAGAPAGAGDAAAASPALAAILALPSGRAVALAARAAAAAAAGAAGVASRGGADAAAAAVAAAAGGDDDICAGSVAELDATAAAPLTAIVDAARAREREVEGVVAGLEERWQALALALA
jgi:hypothetical protein